MCKSNRKSGAGESERVLRADSLLGFAAAAVAVAAVLWTGS